MSDDIAFSYYVLKCITGQAKQRSILFSLKAKLRNHQI